LYLNNKEEFTLLIDNYNKIVENVKSACERTGRDFNDVKIIAVSKTMPVDDIIELYNDGVYEFGENKVQELCDKYSVINEGINYHLIGHLQRNKVKYIIDKACLIHSVDSLRLAETISQEAVKKDIIANILIQVNLSLEDSKSGITKEEVLPLIKEIIKLPNINIKGLMTIPPFVTNPEDNRKYFKELRELFIDINEELSDNISMCHLSMGMTGDYITAVEEGATLIRVGTAIFGNRNYNIV
jgi:pyridoxal phosphate enzyme (YggS family)